jgi:hypothetical protein
MHPRVPVIDGGEGVLGGEGDFKGGFRGAEAVIGGAGGGGCGAVRNVAEGVPLGGDLRVEGERVVSAVEAHGGAEGGGSVGG